MGLALNFVPYIFRILRYNRWLIVLILLFNSALFANSDTLSISITIQDAVSTEDVFIPAEYALHAPFPNPFNSEVNFVIDIPENTMGQIVILNLLGQEIAILHDGNLPPGRFAFAWNASNSSSGIYFIQIRSIAFNRVEKISLIR
jgi:hypothetical protein